jgi:ATP-dependent DNA helicase DinG
LELIATQLAIGEERARRSDPAVSPRHRKCSSGWNFGARDDRSYVYWVERRGRGCFLQATPIDVSGILEEKLFDALDTVILTSATLAVGETFEFTERAPGHPPRAIAGGPQPFRIRKQALLYVPQHMPDPRSPAFGSAAAEEITRILLHSRGRAFVLFTSYQQMRMVYDRVSLEIDYPTLLQGTGPRNALLEEFRATPNCVLFATSSFWQGVDVQGDQLSCVIIDKLPFAVPAIRWWKRASNAFARRAAIRFTTTRSRRPRSR